jgi:hypothetical protein
MNRAAELSGGQRWQNFDCAVRLSQRASDADKKPRLRGVFVV